MEVGVGGEYDPTNVIRYKYVTDDLCICIANYSLQISAAPFSIPLSFNILQAIIVIYIRLTVKMNS